MTIARTKKKKKNPTWSSTLVIMKAKVTLQYFLPLVECFSLAELKACQSCDPWTWRRPEKKKKKKNRLNPLVVFEKKKVFFKRWFLFLKKKLKKEHVLFFSKKHYPLVHEFCFPFIFEIKSKNGSYRLQTHRRR